VKRSSISFQLSHILSDNDSVDHNLYDHTDTIRVGEINDTMPDYCRCTGKLSWSGNVAKIGYCGKWLCWKCGKYRLWSESARLIVASEYIHAAYPDSYWITINQNEPKTMQISDFVAYVGKILRALRDRAKSENKPFEYIGVYDFNEKGKIHLHMVSSFMPDDTIIPRRKKSITSDWFNGLLDRLDLHTYTRVMKDAIHVGKYMSGSLHNTVKTELPEMFNRIIASSNMPRLINPHDQKPHIKAWLDATHGSEYYARWTIGIDARGKEIKPIKMSAWLVQHAIERGGEVWAKCRKSGEIRHYDDYRIDGYGIDAALFDIYTPNDDGCENLSRGKRYDRIRKKTLKRVLQLLAILANRNARKYNVSERILLIHLIILYRLQNGMCFYNPDKPLTEISVDHVIPLSERGKNRIDNIVLCNLEENLKKGTKTGEQYANKLAERAIDHPLRARDIPVQQTMF